MLHAVVCQAFGRKMEFQPTAEIIYLKLFLPNRPERNAGVLLLGGRFWSSTLSLRHHWDQIADPDDAQVLALLAMWLEQRIRDFGDASGETLLRSLEDRLSNVLRLSERQTVLAADARSTLDQLFKENCRS
jgi:4-amino-4-deoxy-L-arabinose transferase-like glycosyltransferase